MPRFVLLALMLTVASPNVDVSGEWQMAQTTFNDANGGREDLPCGFSQQGDRLVGRCGPNALVGTRRGDSLSWQMVVEFDRHTATLTYEGQINQGGTAITGTWHCPKHCENAAYKNGTFAMARRRQPTSRF